MAVIFTKKIDGDKAYFNNKELVYYNSSYEMVDNEDKYSLFYTFDDDCPYNLEDWNQAFAGYSGYIQGNERSKFGICNDNEGLLLIVALILDILCRR